ncbi:hypothetical protein SAMN04487917_103214 [Arthrobacter sp. yr096]|nr:hypothetical protein SAMN04487917_103214 [Arthrobacter sp. yr096]
MPSLAAIDGADLPMARPWADAYDDRGPLGPFSHFRGEKDLSHAVATAQTYKLVAADKGIAIKVRVTGTKSGYTTMARYSVATALIGSSALFCVMAAVRFGSCSVGLRRPRTKDYHYAHWRQRHPRR